MSNIRVTYVGLIAFVAGMMSILFGLFFTLMVTRRLSIEDFGTFSLILSIIGYFLISEVIISFWTIRQIARGEEIGKTSVLSSTMISSAAIPIFAIYVYVISQSGSANFEILLLAAILLPVYFISQTLTAVNLGHRPQASSYGLLVFEILKIPLGLALVVIFDLGVIGAIFALLLATIGKIVIQIYFARSKLTAKFKLDVFRRWLKLSWVPLFAHLQNYIRLIDVVLYTVITGSIVGIAFYQAAFVIAQIGKHAGAISQAIYPKLLYDKNFEGMQNNLRLVLYFGIPLLAISVLFSKPALFALNPIYQDAWLVVIILSFKNFLQVLRTIPTSIISGTEQVDVGQQQKFSGLIKSNLFRLPTILSIFNIIYIIVLIVALFLLKTPQLNDLELVTWWAIIGLGIELPMTICIWIYSKKFAKFTLPVKNTIKFIGATLIFCAVFLSTSEYIINYEPSIYKFLPSLILQLAICVGIYIGITYIIDKETKSLFNSILKEVIGK